MTTRVVAGGRRALNVRIYPLDALLVLTIAVAVLFRILIAAQVPLWLDETYSAVIATQPDFSSLLRWCLVEFSGPVYYGSLWLWEKFAGQSDLALRAPSIILSIATPLLILWKGHPDRTTRLIWAALIVAWPPGLVVTSEARPYALLIFMGTLQTIFLLRLLERSARRDAVGWATVSALMILTHYHALVIVGLQFLVYVARRGRQVFIHWPVVFLAVPVVAWMTLHLPFVFRTMSTGASWYLIPPVASVIILPAMMFGYCVFIGAVSFVILLAVFVLEGLAVLGGPVSPFRRTDVIAVGTGFGAVLVVFVVGLLQPSFNARYLIPFIPSVLLGIAIWTRHASGRWAHAPTVVVASIFVYVLCLFPSAINQADRDDKYVLAFEQPTAWLRSQGANSLVFFWDNPIADTNRPKNLGEIGGFFFKRAGDPVPVTVPVMSPQADPNAILSALATRPGTAIIWAYDRLAVTRSRGETFPAKAALGNAALTCKNFGRNGLTVYTCIRN